MLFFERSVMAVRPLRCHHTLLSLAVWFAAAPGLAQAEAVYSSSEQSRIDSGEKYAQPSSSLKAGSVRQNWALVSSRLDGSDATLAPHSKATTTGKASAARWAPAPTSLRVADNSVAGNTSSSDQRQGLTAAQKMFGDSSVGDSVAATSEGRVAASSPAQTPSAAAKTPDQASGRPTAADAINRFVMGDTGPVVGVSPAVASVNPVTEQRGSVDPVLMNNTAPAAAVKSVKTRSGTKAVASEELKATRKLDTSNNKVAKSSAPTVKLAETDVNTQPMPTRATEMFTRDVTGKERDQLPLSDAEVVPAPLSAPEAVDPVEGFENRRPDTPVLRSAPAS